MKPSILLVHNRYQQPGGEDAVFEAETDLLRRCGHRVRTLEFSSDVISVRPTLIEGIAVALNAHWSRAAASRIHDAVVQHGADVVHFHNTFPLVSASAYYAAHKAGAAVVQSLHNYRLVCPNALLFRDGAICEDCRPRFPLAGVVNGCYRGSVVQTAAVASAHTLHWLVGTWSGSVDQYIALTDFARRKFIAAGLPAERITVKPNFLVRPTAGRGRRNGVVFIGRLAPEKGVMTLLRAWSQIRPTHSLRIVGDGPIKRELQAVAQREGLRNVTFDGFLPRDAARAALHDAAFMIMPSEWYEGFPMTILEAMASGVPTVVSHLGSMAEIVRDGITGIHFAPGNASDLAAKIAWAFDNPERMATMGDAAADEFADKYTDSANYDALMGIYAHALARRAVGEPMPV